MLQNSGLSKHLKKRLRGAINTPTNSQMLALSAGRKRISSQTGLIHLFYQQGDVLKNHDTIPLLENFCFCLALLRTRQSEQILEAKTLLEKLLPFEVEGNFPVYLHEYPVCRDRFIGVTIGIVLFWILRDFFSVLGRELSSKLEQTFERILKEALKQEQIPFGFSKKLSALKKEHCCLDWIPKSTEECADFLIISQIASTFDEEAIFKMNKLAETLWDPVLAISKISNGKYEQERTAPALTLFDLFMCDLFSTYSSRCLKDHPLHLRGALIQPFIKASLPLEPNPKNHLFIFPEKGIYPFVMYWGDRNCVHSLVLHTQGDVKKDVIGESEIEFLVTFPTEMPVDEGDRNEISFFCDDDENTKLWIQHKRATTFQLTDEIELVSPLLRIKFQFTLLSKEGSSFFGHLFKGNRSTQICLKGEERFEAYDWVISLRTIKRIPGITIKINLKLEFFN